MGGANVMWAQCHMAKCRLIDTLNGHVICATATKQLVKKKPQTWSREQAVDGTSEVRFTEEGTVAFME